MKPWLWLALAVLLLGGGWWCLGRLPQRSTEPVPPGHWLSPYLDADGHVDLDAALRDGREPVAAEGNAIVLLLRAWGPEAVSPAADQTLCQELGVDPTAPPALAVPDEGPAERLDLAALMAAAKAGTLTRQPRPVTEASALEQAAAGPWMPGSLPLAEAWLARHREALVALLAESPHHAALPHVAGTPPSRQPEVQLLRTRALGRAMNALAQQRLTAGDCPGAAQAAAWIGRLGLLLLRDSSTVIGGMIGCDLIAQAAAVMERTLADPACGPGEAHIWLAAVADLPWPEDRQAAWMDRHERLLALEVAEILLAEPRSRVAEANLVRRRIVEAYDALHAAALQPDSAARARAGGEAYALLVEPMLATRRSVWALAWAGPWTRRELGTLAVTGMALGQVYPSLEQTEATLERQRLRLAAITTAAQGRAAKP